MQSSDASRMGAIRARSQDSQLSRSGSVPAPAARQRRDEFSAIELCAWALVVWCVALVAALACVR